MSVKEHAQDLQLNTPITNKWYFCTHYSTKSYSQHSLIIQLTASKSSNGLVINQAY